VDGVADDIGGAIFALRSLGHDSIMAWGRRDARWMKRPFNASKFSCSPNKLDAKLDVIVAGLDQSPR
jgi:hypothetical protein